MQNPTVSSQKYSVLWVGGRGGMESELVNKAGIPFEAIPAAGVHGVGIRNLPANLIKLSKGYLAAREIVFRYKPDVLFFTGGYVAVPVGLAARFFSRIKPRPAILLFIPDIEPGLALKTLANFADQVAVSAEETMTYLPSRKSVSVTGYPVREALKKWDRSSALKNFELDDDLPILLVFGGSTGARSINRTLMDSLPALLENIQVLHVSGRRDWDEVQERRKSLPEEYSSRYQAYPYLHEEMGAALAVADLVLSRAGAAVLGEYPHFGLPAILVPYPYAWRYQHTNAQYLVECGGAVILEDHELKNKLTPSVLDLISDPGQLEAMKKAMRTSAKPNAAYKIAAILHELASSKDPKDVNNG